MLSVEHVYVPKVGSFSCRAAGSRKVGMMHTYASKHTHTHSFRNTRLWLVAAGCSDSLPT